MYFKTLSCSGIHQGSNALYRDQPIQGRYERGHLVPVDILRYSTGSALATFTFTNSVPQIAGFNKGQWGKYERKIKKYAQQTCSSEGGTLFLITGISSVTFSRTGSHPVKTIVKRVEPMRWFHNDVDVNQKIAIPNSIWTVGCCLNLDNEVVGAFGVMGNNAFQQRTLNVVLMRTQTVKSVENTLRLEDPTIELFPYGLDCYDPEKNVKLNEI